MWFLDVQRLISLGYFLFFLFVLNTRDVYKISIAVIIFAIIMGFKSSAKIKIKEFRDVLFYLGVVCFFWSYSFDSSFLESVHGDQIVRYILGFLIFLIIANYGLNLKTAVTGAALGCFLSFFIALLQFYEVGRADGYTNAIRFGNLSIVNGVFCLIALFLLKINLVLRVFYFFGFLFGLGASILSLSRGGWLFVIILPVFFIFFNKILSIGRLRLSALLLAFFCALYSLSQIGFVQERISSIEKEVVGYINDPEKYSKTSIGARLEMWGLALRMGLDKPFTGWGDNGVKSARHEYIDRGYADNSIKKWNHSHSQIIETFARKGVVGVFLLFFIYLFPLWKLFFWRERLFEVEDGLRNHASAIIWMGFVFFIGNFVFGLTDYFINMSLGHNYFVMVMMMILGYGCFLFDKNVGK